MILDVLFVAAHWHGLAKLRMHTDLTLDTLDAVTTDLGAKMRSFRDKTCLAFDTKELPRELKARLRKEKKIQIPTNPQPQMYGGLTSVNHRTTNGSTSRGVNMSGGPTSQVPHSINSTASEVESNPHPTISSCTGAQTSTRRPKMLNLNTYKHHALGDYVATIRKFGTTDSYSTEAVSVLQFVHV
jgi:hypothetical protein